MMSYQFTMISMISNLKKIIPRNLGKSSKLFISCFLATKKRLGYYHAKCKNKKSLRGRERTVMVTRK